MSAFPRPTVGITETRFDFWSKTDNSSHFTNTVFEYAASTGPGHEPSDRKTLRLHEHARRFGFGMFLQSEINRQKTADYTGSF